MGFGTFGGLGLYSITPCQKEGGDEQTQFPSGVLLRTLAVHQTALPVSHQQVTICGEREKQGSHPVCRHTLALAEEVFDCHAHLGLGEVDPDI